MNGAVDLHVDTISRLLAVGGEFRSSHPGLAVDPARAFEGGVAALCGACFTADDDPAPRAHVRRMLTLLRELDTDPECPIRQVRTPAELTRLKPTELGVIATIENARSLEGDLEAVDEFAALGVSILGVTWNAANELATGCGVGDVGGLTEFGRSAIARAADLGLAIDISHLNRAGVAEVLALGVPVLATHSNCRAVHDHRRNLDDAQLSALAARGGVVGLNVYCPFLGTPPVTLETFVAHAQHAAELIGIDRLAFGSDLDGIDETPVGFADYRDMPALRSALRSGGFSASEVDGLFGQNFRRWWGSTGS